MAESSEKPAPMEGINECASSSRDLSKTLPEEAFNNFLQGKRHMLVQDYPFAVSSLVKACELYTKHFGELAIECGEVYFLYGKALFRLSQQQSGVLGNVLNEGKEQDDDDDEEEESSADEEGKENDEEGKENESDKNASDAEANENAPEAEPMSEEKEPSEPTDSPEVSNDGSSNVEKKCDDAEASKKNADVQSVDSNAEDKSQEVEEDDLELAWNTLETAKTIFKRQGMDNIEAQLKVAEILQLLAEISMESDNNPAAIADLKECLKIQEQHLSPDDRVLAETYYQLGLAHMLEKLYHEAIGYFKQTMRTIELRIENLTKQPAPSEEAGSFDGVDREIEISNLQGVLPDIREKIEDTEELIRNAKKEMEEAIRKQTEVLESSTSGISSSSTSKPVSNITHLLKRKKPDDLEKEDDSKRLKLSSCISNGESNEMEISSTTNS